MRGGAWIRKISPASLGAEEDSRGGDQTGGEGQLRAVTVMQTRNWSPAGGKKRGEGEA